MKPLWCYKWFSCQSYAEQFLTGKLRVSNRGLFATNPVRKGNAEEIEFSFDHENEITNVSRVLSFDICTSLSPSIAPTNGETCKVKFCANQLAIKLKAYFKDKMTITIRDGKVTIKDIEQNPYNKSFLNDLHYCYGIVEGTYSLKCSISHGSILYDKPMNLEPESILRGTSMQDNANSSGPETEYRIQIVPIHAIPDAVIPNFIRSLGYLWVNLGERLNGDIVVE